MKTPKGNPDQSLAHLNLIALTGDEPESPVKTKKPDEWTALESEMVRGDRIAEFYDSSKPLKPVPQNPTTPKRRKRHEGVGFRMFYDVLGFFAACMKLYEHIRSTCTGLTVPLTGAGSNLMTINLL